MNEKTFVGIFAGVFAFLVLSFYLFFLNHVSINEVGVSFHSGTGKLEIQPHPGWYVTSPLVKVVTISTVPEVVHIPSMANVINTKIVRIKPEAITDYVKLQGFSYNLGASQNNILMGYAFSGQTYSFLEIVQQGGVEVFTK
jgi:hypothetical protein